jgi:two-component system, chemotaxis family, response regulator WspR
MSDTSAVPEKLRVLVVDDEGLVRDVLAEVLSAQGHEVELAESGEAALGLIEAARDFDLIISDMNMPGIGGLELIRRVRLTSPELPVIILTGSHEVRLAIEAMRSGANDYLLKDEDIEDTLTISIGSVMETHRLKLENARLLEDLARKNQELERLSFLDGLTGIPNRRYFDKVIADEWSRACREGATLSVVLVDVDHFKAFNDRYGHPSGDACLRDVAGVLSRSVGRSADFVARYGGEEFVAVLPGTPLDGAVDVAEAMRRAVDALGIPHESSSVCGHVTISLGVSSVTPAASAAYSEMVRQADEALYAAKRQGRNRVMS